MFSIRKSLVVKFQFNSFFHYCFSSLAQKNWCHWHPQRHAFPFGLLCVDVLDNCFVFICFVAKTFHCRNNSFIIIDVTCVVINREVVIVFRKIKLKISSLTFLISIATKNKETFIIFKHLLCATGDDKNILL